MLFQRVVSIKFSRIHGYVCDIIREYTKSKEKPSRWTVNRGQTVAVGVYTQTQVGSTERFQVIRTHTDGKLCELILEEWLFERGYWVMKPTAEPCPADFVAISPSGDIFLLDSKKDNRRVLKGRNQPTRIYRKLNDIQKRLGVRMAYVDLETREVNVVPKIPD